MVEYNSFTTEKGKGNPAGVVFLEGESPDAESMLRIAKSFGFNETVFISPWEDSYRLRFFAPGHEVDLCGHATIAALGYLRDNQLLSGGDVRIMTNIGAIHIGLGADEMGNPLVSMQQGESSFVDFKGSVERLCGSLGMAVDDLDSSLPIVYGSTGIWTLLVPLKNRARLKDLKPNNAEFPSILEELPRASVHPYSIESLAVDNAVHARHFSSPFSQTIEDPVTGTASGVIGEFLLSRSPKDTAMVFTVHQGAEVGRPGKVFVSAQRGKRVVISGHYVKNGD